MFKIVFLTVICFAALGLAIPLVVKGFKGMTKEVYIKWISYSGALGLLTSLMFIVVVTHLHHH